MQLVKDRQFEVEHTCNVRQTGAGGDGDALGGNRGAGGKPDATHATTVDLEASHTITRERGAGAEGALEQPRA